MIVVVLSPHRDDAAFSLGLSIDAWIAAGHTVSVLNCFTQSTYAPFSDVEQVHTNDRVSFVSALRRREDLAWNKLTKGKLSFHDLDLLDAPLRLNCDADEVITVEIRPGDRARARVHGAIAKIIRKAQAGDKPIAVVAPLAAGSHIDHRVVHNAAVQSLNESAIPFAFYEDLPYATREGEAALLPGRAADTDPSLSPMFATSPPSDFAKAEKRKLRLTECYDSQIDTETASEIAAFARSYSGRERLWANAAWRESGLSTPETEA